MLTSNEKKVLRLLLSSYDTDYSINSIAKECKLAPNGAYKILTKFEKEGILSFKKIANLKSYKLNFQNNKIFSILELALIPELEKKIQLRLEDLKNLKNITKSCVFFGSYLNKKEPDDLDIFFIVEKQNYKKYSDELEKAKEIIPIKIHDVVQTVDDLKQNIQKKDEVIINILRKGVIVWGHDVIIQMIKDVYR
jgi:hypothetical protein